MNPPRELDPYRSPRDFYGAELRRLRQRAGLTQAQLAQRVFCSVTYVVRLESAERRPRPDLSKLFDEELGGEGHLQRLCELARQSRHPDYFADVAELEKLATTISDYSPTLIPGLLQTEAYARSLTMAAQPFAPADQVEERVMARTERARLLEERTMPELWAVLHEAALRVSVGGPHVMREQLSHLAGIARSHRRVKVQVLTDAAGAHAFLNGLVCLLTFDDAPPLAYTEGAYTGQLIEEPCLVARYRRAYDVIRAAALSPEDSLALIESVAKDCRHHDQ